MNPEYPEEYSNWQKVEPRELIDAEILKSVSEKGVADAVRSLSKKADRVVIATDFDREGELIGVEALSLVFEANPKLVDHVERARFSALTPGEVNRAFDELVEVSRELAEAGEARQDIDLIWGATLTRWVSRATKRYGPAFLSVGRVQSPTLALIAEREKERRAFVPVPYWELEVDLKNGEPFTVRHGTARFEEEAKVNAAYENIADEATVTEVQQKSATRKPPTPFNTTAFLTAASSLGYSPSRAARLAEDLYTDGYISYPRTDNTVYPQSLDLREVLGLPHARRGGRPVRGEAAAAGRALADAGQEGDDGPPPDLPDRPRLEGRAAGRPVEDLPARRPPLPGHALRPVEVPAHDLALRLRRRAAHHGRHGRHRGGLARGLPLQPPRRRGDTGPLRGRRGRRSSRRRSTPRRPSRRAATARDAS